jgi:hypothetical protein
MTANPLREGQAVTVSGRGASGTETWPAVYLCPVGAKWCEVRRHGQTFRVPEKLVEPVSGPGQSSAFSTKV